MSTSLEKRSKPTGPEDNELSTPARIIMMKAGGLSVPEIAEEIGKSEKTVRMTLSSPLARERLSRIQTKIDEYHEEASEEDPVEMILKTAAPRAARTLQRILSSGDVKESRMAAQDILDRSGYGKTQTNRMEHTFQLSEEDAERLTETMDMLSEATQSDQDAIETTARVLPSGDHPPSPAPRSDDVLPSEENPSPSGSGSGSGEENPNPTARELIKESS